MQTSRTLTIPQTLYERICRVAKSQHREMSEVAAAVLEEGLPLLESQLPDPDWQREKEAFQQLHATLWHQYPGAYVAIHGGQLVDVDQDRVALFKRIDEQFPQKIVLIRQVREEPEIVYEHRSIRWS
jgi:hypothetical protein